MIVLGLAGLLLAAGCARTPEQINQRQARRMAAQVLREMGGQNALRDIRFLQFDYIDERTGSEPIRRTHLWDRQTGDYRLEWRDGSMPYLVLFNVKTRQGRAWKRLRPAEGEEAEELLRLAYTAYRNDTFWLLSVEHLADPDVRLADDGDNLVQGRLCPTLEMWLKDAGGPSPHGRYLYYIDNRTEQPFVWAFDTDDPANPTRTFLWSNWQTIGDFSVPTRYEEIEGGHVIRFNNLFAPASMSPRVFNEP